MRVDFLSVVNLIKVNLTSFTPMLCHRPIIGLPTCSRHSHMPVPEGLDHLLDAEHPQGLDVVLT